VVKTKKGENRFPNWEKTLYNLVYVTLDLPWTCRFLFILKAENKILLLLLHK